MDTAAAAAPNPNSTTNTAEPKRSIYTNVVLKPQHHHRHPPPVFVLYKECLKNHAASLGGHAVDGCGEFLPSFNSTTTAPTDSDSLTCAACGCHRNFHRREEIKPLQTNVAAVEYHPQHRHQPLPPPGFNIQSPSPISAYPSAPHLLLSLRAGENSAPPQNNNTSPTGGGGGAPAEGTGRRKRCRTRFTHEQKRNMVEFAERMKWKMHKSDGEAIGKFCSEIGVEKGAFKAWMNNNKSVYGSGARRGDNVASGTNNNNNGGTDFCRNYDVKVEDDSETPQSSS